MCSFNYPGAVCCQDSIDFPRTMAVAAKQATANQGYYFFFLAVKFKAFSRFLPIFDQIQGFSGPGKNVWKFKAFSRFPGPVGTLLPTTTDVDLCLSIAKDDATAEMNEIITWTCIMKPKLVSADISQAWI